MASNFPTSLDTFSSPTPTTSLDGGGDLLLAHSNQHNKLNDAVSALQQVIGITGSTDVNSLQYKLQNVTTTPGPVGPTGPAGLDGQSITGPVGPTGPAGSVSTSSDSVGNFFLHLGQFPGNTISGSIFGKSGTWEIRSSGSTYSFSAGGGVDGNGGYVSIILYQRIA